MPGGGADHSQWAGAGGARDRGSAHDSRGRADKEAPFDTANVRQALLSDEVQLRNLQESYSLALDRFKVRLGIPVRAAVTIEPVTLELPEPDISLTRATELALTNRLDFQTVRDQVDDARRGVDNARNQTLPDLNLTGGLTLRTNPDEAIGGLPFDPDDSDLSASITFGLPLDREIERLTLRSAQIRLQQQVRDYEEFIDLMVLDVRQTVRAIDLARYALKLQEQALADNLRRQELLRLREDDVDIQDRIQAQDDLLDSRNDLDAALRSLRVAILEYLLASGQLRVDRDGTFIPLQGMVVQYAQKEDTTPTPSRGWRMMLPDFPVWTRKMC